MPQSPVSKDERRDARLFCVSFYFRTVIGSANPWSPSPIITVLEIAPSLLQPINIGPFFYFLASTLPCKHGLPISVFFDRGFSDHRSQS